MQFLYLFFKWLHLVAIISWMAGILYLYRLFVNISERGSDPKVHEVLTIMARKLYRIITNPAMIVAFIGGGGMLAVNPDILRSGGWLHLKLVLVIALSGATGYAGALLRRFEKKDPKVPSSRALRMMNEIPTVLMLIIVALAVFRPF